MVVTKESRIQARQISGMSRTAAWLAWSSCAVCVVLAVLTLVLTFVVPPLENRPNDGLAVLMVVIALAYPTVGALIATRLPANPIGWLFCGLGLFFVAQRVTEVYADYALLVNSSLPWGESAAWFSTTVAGGSPSGLVGVLVLLLFPDGRLLSRRWRVVEWTAIIGAAFGIVGDALYPGDLPTHTYVENPFGVLDIISGAFSTFELFAASSLFGWALMSMSNLAALYSLILRLRRARGDERQQLKWFLFAVVPGVLFGSLVSLRYLIGRFAYEFMFGWWEILPWDEVVYVMYASTFALLLVPVFTYVAILRYNLYDIDLVINRTLVYGALTACVVGIYVLAVVVLGALFQTQGNLAISLSATGLVAVAFQPLRSKLQRSVNRLMYGERDEPYAVVSRLGKRLEAAIEPEAVLPTVVETIAQALKLPYAAMLLKEGEGYRTAASYGSPKGEPETLPLVYQREEIGRLVLSPRAPGEAFSEADRSLLEDLARQAEVAVHAVRLTADLQRSRERLVATREEERRRLRRDLHVGLGAQLAGLNVQTGTLRRVIPCDPDAADELVVELREELRGAISDIRRLVYDLRPPALDDLGLVEALRQLAERYDSKDEPLRVAVEAPEDLTNLPAAVEVAVYRITQEALTNVARHARAKTCVVRLAVNDNVALEIVDDGVGMPSGRSAGVGLSSMHERAEELGGGCTVEALPEGGTRVLARLPLAKE
jgi:signal transduction histidine kinase